LECSLSVIVPAYNEEERLPDNLPSIAEYLARSGKQPAEILIVNDGSTDRTPEISRDIAARLTTPNLSVQVLDNPGNRGKGYSVRHGALKSRMDWALFTDADLSSPIEECDRLFEAVCGGCQIAIGSRALKRDLIGVHQSKLRETVGRIFNLSVRVVTGLPFRDTQCGFKLFSRRAVQEIFPRQRLERFGFDVELLFLARKFGFEVAEVPVRWNHSEGTKVGMLSGADAFLDVWRVRWNDLRGLYSAKSVNPETGLD